MPKANLPIGLPSSDLLDELTKKANALGVLGSRAPDYIGWLKLLRERIAPELSYINVTFPLFTPHDETNHIHPLFHLADRLLGRELLSALNAAELFILAASLYAHDWGMAVSEGEKRCLAGLAAPSSNDAFVLVDGDRHAFEEMLKREKIRVPPNATGDIEAGHWQDYVRGTHATRSAQRVRKFFATLDPHLGDAIALVSEGHNLELEHVRSFPNSHPIATESANLRAVAVYLRLIDLFDLGQDRTPYALWKFISPDHTKSAEEWNKHRSLNSVAVELFQTVGRCIKVRGATDDHRVYAALEDLREYCESQLRLSNGLLNELDQRYQPRLFHLDWLVEAKSFDPIKVRFEFDRPAMIELLSDHIYQGDSHVFLRELLQNSIDAIRLRRELHIAKGTGVTFDGRISVTVERQTDCRTVVSWRDNGCGMNAFIVRNYLAVAGRSFYRSDDFRKLGVTMDPIARFGIGILSCFMVSESIEIFTRQDPQLEVTAEALKIEICHPNRHFRVQRCAPDHLQVGTTVRVFLNPRAQSDGESRSYSLDVTRYLREIAGFVEFPIYIEEYGAKTAIIRPQAASATKLSEEGCTQAMLNTAFSWTDFFLPQDVAHAKKFFAEVSIPIKLNSRNAVFEGMASYIGLNESFELKQDFRGRYPYDETAHSVCHDGKELGILIRTRRRLETKRSTSPYGRSGECDNLCRIYCDGILVPGVSIPNWIDQWRLPTTLRIVLNIRRSGEISLDVSRHAITSKGENWRDFVFEQCVRHFRANAKARAAKQPPVRAYYHLARLLAYESPLHQDLSELLNGLVVPLIILDDSGQIRIVSSEILEQQTVRTVPKSMAKALSQSIFDKWASADWMKSKPEKFTWHGGTSIFTDRLSWPSSDRMESVPVTEWMQKAWVTCARELTAVRFLFPAKAKEWPVVQEEWVQRSNAKHGNETAKIAAGIKADLTKLRSEFGYYAPTFVEFREPFQDFFTAGWNYLNIHHPIVKALSDCVSAVSRQATTGGVSEHDLGLLRDSMQPLFGERHLSLDDYLSPSEIQENYARIRDLFSLTSRLAIYEAPDELLGNSKNLFIPIVKKVGKFGAPIRSLKDAGIVL